MILFIKKISDVHWRQIEMEAFMNTRKIAVLTAITLVATIMKTDTVLVQAATTPAFVTESVKLEGVGKVNQYTLKLINTEKYRDLNFVWTSSNPKVVKVAKEAGQGDAQNGYYCNLIPKTKGTAVVKCVVNYTTKKNVQKKKTLKASVEVTVPSDRSEDNRIVNKEISDEKTQTMYIYQGDTYTVEGAISPIGSSDSIFWKSTDESVFTVDHEGVVTAVGEGAAVLEMYVGATEESALAQEKLDSLKIRTIARPSVKSVQLSDANTLVITFTHAVAKSSVVSGTSLTTNVSIIPTKKDDKEGRDLGDIYAVLTGKTLVITTKNEFSGVYQIIVSDEIVTTDQVRLAAYDEVKKVVLSLE